MATLLGKISNIAGLGKSIFAFSKDKIGEIVIDCTFSKNVKYSSTITEQPVEANIGLGSSSMVSDHRYINPIIISVEGSITDDPLDIVGTIKSVADIFTGNIAKNIVDKYKGKGRKQIAAFEALEIMHKEGTFIDVVTDLRVYENMQIESPEFPRDGNTGNQLKFNKTLKQTTFAGVKFVSLVNNTNKTNNLIAKKVNIGSQETVKANDVEVEKAKSGAKNLQIDIKQGLKNIFGYK